MLIIIRHGQTNWNAVGRFQGNMDIPLNETGCGQARRNGMEIKAYLEHYDLDVAQFDFVCSPLSRTRQTMALVREELGLAPIGVRFDDRLKEISFGVAEGKTMAEIERDLPEVYSSRQADKWGYQMPGGESYAMVRERVADWLKSLRPHVIVVTHGGTGRVIRGELMDLPTGEIPQMETPQDKFYLWHDNQGAWL